MTETKDQAGFFLRRISLCLSFIVINRTDGISSLRASYSAGSILHFGFEQTFGSKIIPIVLFLFRFAKSLIEKLFQSVGLN